SVCCLSIFVCVFFFFFFFFFQAEDGIRDFHVTGVQTCALPISKSFSSVICMGLYLAFSGCSQTPSLVTFKRFTVNSPSKKQMAIRLCSGSRLLSITNKSLSSNPAPIIDCPLTRAKKVASLFLISSLSKDRRCSLKSSAGDGNPAEIPVSKKKAPRLLASSGEKNVNG